MGINRSYSIPLSGGPGYQSNAHAHASGYDQALRHSQDTVHTGTSDVNRSLHSGHGHGDIRGGEDENENDDGNDAGSEKGESMSLDFGHNMESMSIDDGTSVPTLLKCMYVCMYVFTFVCVHICLHVYVHVHVCVCMCARFMQ